MKNLHYSTTINAPKEKVWDTMLGETTYPKWTSIFMPGSHYKGSWQKGTEMDFLAPGDDGIESGMRARVAESTLYEFVSVQHLAEINGTDVTPFEKEGESFENYTYKENGGTTEVSVDLVNIPDEWAEMMGDSWPRALSKLKEMVEA